MQCQDHYALPDIRGCVTKAAGSPNDAVVGRNTKTSSEEKESRLSGKKAKITGVVILLLVVGGIGGIIVTVVTGITTIFSDI
jgi:hypothetical protein